MSKDVKDAIEKSIQDLIRQFGPPPIPDNVMYDLLRLLVCETLDRVSGSEELVMLEVRRVDVVAWRNESLLRLRDFARK
jgi:hypothetical protein